MTEQIGDIKVEIGRDLITIKKSGETVKAIPVSPTEGRDKFREITLRLKELISHKEQAKRGHLR